MPSVSENPETTPQIQEAIKKPGIISNIISSIRSMLHLPKNVYLLLFFTLGKGMQLTISTLTVNLYAHSLGYRPDFIGIFSAMPALGAMVSAVPVGMLADRVGRKPVLIISAILTPLCLMALGLVTSAPLLLILSLLQGFVSTAYWVSNLPLLIENTTERQRVEVLALNSFLLLGVGALGNLLGGAIPEFVSGLLHVAADSTVPLRWGVITAALFTLVFGLPLWFLHEPKQALKQKNEKKSELSTEQSTPDEIASPISKKQTTRLFIKLLIPDLLFTTGEGAVVALIQLFFVLRFQLQPGTLGILFTISGLGGGLFSLTAPLFVNRWSKLRIVTTVQYLSAPLMILIGFAPALPLAIAGEYARSFGRTLIEPVYAAFAMEQVSSKQRATLAGLYSVTWSVGYSVGPTIAGWLQTQVNLSASFAFGAFCLIICPSLLLLFFYRRSR